MGLVAEQAVLNLHFRSMAFMTIEAGLILALGETMGVMTVGAILLAMGAGQGC